MRVALTVACLVALFGFAVAWGFSAGVDQYGHVDAYPIDAVALLTFAALDITAVSASGAIGRFSASTAMSCKLLFLAGLAYSVSVLARHPGQFAGHQDGVMPDIATTILGIGGVCAEAAVLGLLLGVAASALLLGYRWFCSKAWPRLGARL